ncbi:XrtB/PEP-CTERM-associated polysaccharide biosynthesis outer membrane protein EpsL [Duganella qianjiadongensis]|uniref:Exopolysaccharide biosynthesis operon protein EpsL n=1 Tax=Duganella qianjiadongensis TaxID=2692176 RepID=A0ABW9VQI4_9BURK|nr:XrtB/PEP-CTERM-associated polysaccharide biosynthesis outer membrane protein EpsL [Duganella qianjiadongensis]MYM41666.1 hypothetical protein [Duganella qianjiadongensis]
MQSPLDIHSDRHVKTMFAHAFAMLPAGLRKADFVRNCWLGVALMSALGANAQQVQSGIHPYATIGQSYDDNLFRLSDNNPGYGGVRSDRYTQLQAGLLVNETLGRQTVKFQANASRVKFEHFTQLDYNGKDAQVEWDWQLGNRLQGTAGMMYAQVLAPYTDVLTSERNLRVQRDEFATARWSFHPSWRATLGYTRDVYSYDLTSQAYNNRTVGAGMLGIDYLASTGSSVGVRVDQIRSRYDILRSISGRMIDAGNDQNDVKLDIDWRVTPITSVQFLGGWAKRKHVYFTERDSSGFNAKLKAATSMDGQLGLNGAIWREFVAVESSVASYATQTGVSANLFWNLTSKLQATGEGRVERRAYSGLLVSATTLDVSDRNRRFSLGLIYMPLNKLQVSTSVFEETRTGLASLVLGNGNYRAKGISLNVNVQY